MSPNVAFVTNFCPHYRVKTFETLSQQLQVTYFFFSAGDDWYWQQQHGVSSGDFKYRYLPSFQLGKTRVSPTLLLELIRRPYDVYIKCINGRFALPITFLVARLKRKPFILWTGVWMRFQTAFHRLFFPLVRYIYRHADAVVVYGEHVRRYLIDEGVQPDRIFIAAHAIDNARYNEAVAPSRVLALRQQLGIDPKQSVILYLGRLVMGKGVPILLQAFSQLSDAQDTVLVIAGEGELRKSLEKTSTDLGLDPRVCFPGYVPVEQTSDYYAMASIFVLPSVTTDVFKEPWGLVINEAMNQRLPVIATEAVGAAQGGLVEHDVTGLIVPEQDSQALVGALGRLLDDPAYRTQLGENAYTRVQRWDNERMVQGFVNAVDHVMNKDQ